MRAGKNSIVFLPMRSGGTEDFMKKIICIVLSVFLLGFSLVSYAEKSEFKDMPDNWATVALENAVKNGLLTGDNGYIMPNDKLTRAQMAAILVRAFGAEVTADISSFTDVTGDDWFYDYMSKAVNMGWFNGDGDKLNPNDAITREQAFAVISRAFSFVGSDLSALDAFSDKGDISDWALSDVAACVSGGYAHGDNGKINPKSGITRAEFAVLMNNIVKVYIFEPGVYSELEEGGVLVRVSGVTFENAQIKGNLYWGPSVGADGVVLKNTSVSGRVISNQNYTKHDEEENNNEDNNEENNNDENSSAPSENTDATKPSGGGSGSGSGVSSGSSSNHKTEEKEEEEEKGEDEEPEEPEEPGDKEEEKKEEDPKPTEEEHDKEKNEGYDGYHELYEI